ncbi:response regulator [Okeanomitos corallinicola TIOX110]|uniref:Protein PatA n=1 Tax=Okeanomitos corallinicola TIOX110 TaxID=3133117 RepID=A0ABZ2US54_9CYAN
MVNMQIVEFNKLIKELIKELSLCRKFKYTGELNIKNNQGRTWIFYYQYGQVVWATGGKHPYRRLCRNILQYSPQVDISNSKYFTENILVDYWDYLVLKTLYANQDISKPDINNIVKSTISEVLFDIFQHINSSSLSFDKNQELLLKPSFSSIDINTLVSQVGESLYKWKEAGLEGICPELVPVLQQPEQLKQQVTPLVYQNLQRLINGKNTLWEISVKMKKNIVQITRSLLPYIRQNIINLIEVPDLPLPTNKIKKISQFKVAKNTNVPLIACIDDSPQICQILDQIITAHGMRFIGIEHPLQALPILIENKPDLIFLDLVMPVVSGYEVCEQLRRCSYFTKTPIVILTGNDGVFDRVRSRVFGATEFITKPVESEKIIRVVDKYLQPKTRVTNFSNSVFSYQNL